MINDVQHLPSGNNLVHGESCALTPQTTCNPLNSKSYEEFSDAYSSWSQSSSTSEVSSKYSDKNSDEDSRGNF